MSFEQQLMSNVTRVIDKTYSEVPCFQLVQELLGDIPGPNSKVVSKDYIQVGDVVCFGTEDGTWVSENTCLGVYLGNGKLITTFKDWGVKLIPWRMAYKDFIWGLRRG